MQSMAGPGIIIIRPETAVVLEWMGEVSQIKGPGKAHNKMFERIKEVIDLRPQWGNTNEFTATTAEGETVTVQARRAALCALSADPTRLSGSSAAEPRFLFTRQM